MCDLPIGVSASHAPASVFRRAKAACASTPPFELGTAVLTSNIGIRRSFIGWVFLSLNRPGGLFYSNNDRVWPKSTLRYHEPFIKNAPLPGDHPCHRPGSD